MTTLDESVGTAPAAPPVQVLCIVFPEPPKDAPPPAEHAEHAEIPWPQRLVWPCRKGQIVARLMAVDQVPPDLAELTIAPDALQTGKHIEWNGDHTALVSTADGRYLLRKNLLDVETEWHHKEDLDATAGPIDFPGAVHLQKSILDLVHLTALGDITVHGSIEAATIHSGTHVTIHHGVCAKNHGLVSADGNVSFRFASNGRVRAHGNILVGNEINNSDLFCRGAILADHAALLSGHVCAVQKITCETAGSDSGVRLLLELSLPAETLAAITPVLAELKQLHTRSQHIRASIEPLMKNAKRLTNQQKEKATELLCTAAELEEKAAELTKSLESAAGLLDQVMNGTVEIRARVYPDVTVVIAGLQTTFQREQTGPFKIARRDEGGTPRLVAIDSHNHATPLPTNSTALLPVLQQLRLAAHPAAAAHSGSTIS
ncbi:MAG: FapA family protein [Phycisphaerae bacterium]